MVVGKGEGVHVSLISIFVLCFTLFLLIFNGKREISKIKETKHKERNKR